MNEYTRNHKHDENEDKVQIIIKTMIPIIGILVLSAILSIGLRSTYAVYFDKAQPFICGVMTVLSIAQAWMLYKVWKNYKIKKEQDALFIG